MLALSSITSPPSHFIVFTEVLTNPLLSVLSPQPLVSLCSSNPNLTLIVDNTLTSPCICRPLEWGAVSMVVESITKVSLYEISLPALCSSTSYASPPKVYQRPLGRNNGLRNHPSPPSSVRPSSDPEHPGRGSLPLRLLSSPSGHENAGHSNEEAVRVGGEDREHT